MRDRFALVLIAVSWVLALPLFADPLRSEIINAQTGARTFTVPELQILRIRSFTQDAGGSARGVVMVGGKSVLTAALVDAASAPESIKSIVIAGPATVTVNPVANANLFLTFKKHIEAPAMPTPTATPTATATATVTPTPTSGP